MTDYAARRETMVDTQVRPSDVTKFPIIDAMLTVPRELFVPREQREAAYMGENLELERGRVILDPRTFSKMLDALNLGGRDLVLHVAAGTGYGAAVIAHVAEAVVALEENPDLAREAQALLSEYGADSVVTFEGPLAEGAPQHGPYDAILVEGGVEEVPPALIDQLKENGRIVCLFMEGALGVVRIGYKYDGAISWRFAFNAAAPVLPGFEKAHAFQL